MKTKVLYHRGWYLDNSFGDNATDQGHVFVHLIRVRETRGYRVTVNPMYVLISFCTLGYEHVPLVEERVVLDETDDKSAILRASETYADLVEKLKAPMLTRMAIRGELDT